MFSTKRQRLGRGWDAPAFNGVDDLLGDSRSRLERVSARAAYQEVLFGRATLVDIRPQGQREQEGEVHPDLAPVAIERNVLEWRLDPRHASSLPIADLGLRVILLCRRATPLRWPQMCCCASVSIAPPTSSVASPPGEVLACHAETEHPSPVSSAVPIAAAVALVAAFLNAAFGLCLGCALYLLQRRWAPNTELQVPGTARPRAQAPGEAAIRRTASTRRSTSWTVL
jgi:hypothetical protein